RPRAGVGHAPQGNPGSSVDDGEDSTDQTQLKVAEIPLQAQRLIDDRRDGTVEEVEQVGQKQQEQDAPRIGRLLVGALHAETPRYSCTKPPASAAPDTGAPL